MLLKYSFFGSTTDSVASGALQGLFSKLKFGLELNPQSRQVTVKKVLLYTRDNHKVCKFWGEKPSKVVNFSTALRQGFKRPKVKSPSRDCTNWVTSIFVTRQWTTQQGLWHYFCPRAHLTSWTLSQARNEDTASKGKRACRHRAPELQVQWRSSTEGHTEVIDNKTWQKFIAHLPFWL